MLVDPVGNTREALDRTLVLMRDHIRDDVDDETLLRALTECTVTIVCDRRNAATHAGQTTIVTTALLCARMGIGVQIVSDDAPLDGLQPPLKSGRLLDGLVEVGQDLVPGCSIRVGMPETHRVCVLVGDTPLRGAAVADFTTRVTGSRWMGRLVPAAESGNCWGKHNVPFGAMAGSALVAGEVFKSVMRTLRSLAKVPIGIFDDTFAPSFKAGVRLAPSGTPCPANLGTFDFISGGALTHSALYSLMRIESVIGRARMIEPQTYDLPNINRYSLMRRSDSGTAKAIHLAAFSTSDFRILPIPRRYDRNLQLEIAPLAPRVLVGVDDVPSRWLAQECSHEWLACGATEHYSTVTSVHSPGLPCLACLHPDDGGVDPRAATVSFVSFWAGLWMAALLVRQVAGEQPHPARQAVWTSMLRSESGHAVSARSVSSRNLCRLGCQPARVA